MTGGPSIFRKTFDAVALFALLNLLAIGGLIGYGVQGGWITPEKVQKVVEVIKGEDEDAELDAEDEAPIDILAEMAPDSLQDVLAESEMDKEVLRREAERIKAELAQRLALNNSILLRVTTERERFAKEVEETTRKRRAAGKRRDAAGFKKQVAIYAALSPKIAAKHLLAMEDPSEASRLLQMMDTRKAKQIVESVKRGDDLRRMRVILDRLRDTAPERSDALVRRP